MTKTKVSDDQAKAKSRSWSLWLWVCLAFIILISAWALLIFIATTNKPEVIDTGWLKLESGVHALALTFPISQ